MTYKIKLQEVPHQFLAVVRDHATLNDLGKKIGAIYSENAVYSFLKDSKIEKYGKNIIVYWDEDEKGLLCSNQGLPVEVGVQVFKPFENKNPVICSATPAGKTVTTLHIGPYDKLPEAHVTLRDWCKRNNHPIAGPNWEVYGDWNEDSNKLQTEIFYLLK